MAEINAQQHIGKIFAAAQRLMEARRQLATAKIDAEESEADLERLNGSTSLDLGRLDGTRYFECEGDQKVRLEFGDTPALGSTPEKCSAVIRVESWNIDRKTNKPEETPMCNECRRAHGLQDAQANPKTDTIVEKVAAEIPF